MYDAVNTLNANQLQRIRFFIFPFKPYESSVTDTRKFFLTADKSSWPKTESIVQEKKRNLAFNALNCEKNYILSQSIQKRKFNKKIRKKKSNKMASLLFAKRYERRIVSTISIACHLTFAYQIDSSSILQMYLRVYVYIYVYDTTKIRSFKTTNSTSERLKTTKPMTFRF